jgi:chitodextrinase
MIRLKDGYITQTWRIAVIAVLLGFCVAVFSKQGVIASSCTPPATDYGTDTLTVDVPETATYVLWTRIMVPDTTNNSIDAQVDDTTCFNVGDSSSVPANTWTWVDYQGGITGTPNMINLTAGDHTLELIGTVPGVSVDRVILTADTTCIPSGTGDNCASDTATSPTVNLTNPTNSSTVSGTVDLAATATDTAGISSVEFLVDGSVVDTDTTSPYSYSWDSTTVSNGQHTIVAQATDTNGNTATSSVTVTVNNAATCTAAPSVPTSLQKTSTTPSSVGLSWTASTPAANCTLQGYNIYRNGALDTTVTGTSYTDTGLTPSTAYSYTVAATDTSGHASAQSGSVSATTTADTSPPTVPSGLATTLITSHAVALSWNASTDNVGVAGYNIYRNGTKVGTSSGATYSDTGLSPNTTYTYTVSAYDAAGNTSAASSSVQATTLTGPAAIVGDLNGDGVVNIVDLSILLSHWGNTHATASQGDLNGDGVVNIVDLSILLSHWSN